MVRYWYVIACYIPEATGFSWFIDYTAYHKKQLMSFTTVLVINEHDDNVIPANFII